MDQLISCSSAEERTQTFDQLIAIGYVIHRDRAGDAEIPNGETMEERFSFSVYPNVLIHTEQKSLHGDKREGTTTWDRFLTEFHPELVGKKLKKLKRKKLAEPKPTSEMKKLAKALYRRSVHAWKDILGSGDAPALSPTAVEIRNIIHDSKTGNKPFACRTPFVYGIFSALIGEKIPPVEGGGMAFPIGTIIVPIKNTTRHAYPLEQPAFVRCSTGESCLALDGRFRDTMENSGPSGLRLATQEEIQKFVQKNYAKLAGSLPLSIFNPSEVIEDTIRMS